MPQSSFCGSLGVSFGVAYAVNVVVTSRTKSIEIQLLQDHQSSQFTEEVSSLADQNQENV